MPTIYVLSRSMKNIRNFLSENIHFLVVKFSVYLNRHVFIKSKSERLRNFALTLHWGWPWVYPALWSLTLEFWSVQRIN